MWWIGTRALARRAAAGALPAPRLSGIGAGHPRHTAAGALLALTALVFVLATTSACASAGAKSSAQQTMPTPTLISSCPEAASAAPGDRLTHVACLAVRGLVGRVQTTYDPQTQTAQVTATFVGTRVPRSEQQIGAAQEAVKAVCFRAQHALWTSGVALRQVTVTVQGPILDDFFNVITDWYGGSRLTATSATALDWQRMAAASAWGHYDQVWLRTAYAPNQYYSSTPPA